jgi:transposase-like protein
MQTIYKQIFTNSKDNCISLLKRERNVYTEIVLDCSSTTLLAIVRDKASIDSVIHLDGWRGYNGLVDFAFKKYFHLLKIILKKVLPSLNKKDSTKGG